MTLKSSTLLPCRASTDGRRACGLYCSACNYGLFLVAPTARLPCRDAGYWPSSRLWRIFPASTAVSMTPRMTDAVWPTSHSFPGNVGPAGLTLSRQLSRFSLHRVFR